MRGEALVALARDELRSRLPQQVAVIAAADPAEGAGLTACVEHAWPAATVTRAVPGDDLALAGPFDLIVDVAGRGLRKRQERLLGLVRPGGVYAGIGGGSAYRVITSRKAMLSPLREPEQNEVLRRQPARGRLIATRPAVQWDARTETRLSRPTPGLDHPVGFEVPELFVREYDGATCLPHQAAIQDGFVLAESFREYARKRLKHPSLETADFGYLTAPGLAAEHLPGRWFLWDTTIPDHFGHAVTEQLSHTWGWHEAKQHYPGIKALVFAPPHRDVAQWAWELWAAAGVPPQDVHVATEPVRVDQLVACSPMLRISGYVHPEMADVWRKAGDELARSPVRSTWPKRIFHTRRGAHRSCNNREEVETFFADRGFLVISPEEYGVAEQVQLARHAEVVAGFAGSGMYQIAFTDRPKQVIAIGKETYAAHNEHVICSLLGHQLDLIVCESDIKREQPDKFSAAAYTSNFTFDLKRDGDGCRCRARARMALTARIRRSREVAAALPWAMTGVVRRTSVPPSCDLRTPTDRSRVMSRLNQRRTSGRNQRRSSHLNHRAAEWAMAGPGDQGPAIGLSG